MTSVTLNHENHTIVITKAFSKAASVPRSNEYNELTAIRLDNPDYAVVVRQTGKRASGTNCITHKTIENYISKHDETGEIMKTYLKLKNEEAGEKLHKTTFFQITKWFFETYPELKTVA